MGRREEPHESAKPRCHLRGSERAFRPGIDYLEIFDDVHSIIEDRFIAIGPIPRGLVLVVWTERDEETIRIISARWATKNEQDLYRVYLENMR